MKLKKQPTTDNLLRLDWPLTLYTYYVQIDN